MWCVAPSRCCWRIENVNIEHTKGEEKTRKKSIFTTLTECEESELVGRRKEEQERACAYLQSCRPRKKEERITKPKKD